MMRLLRLFGVLFSLSLRRQLAFRADMVFDVLVNIVGLLSSFAALSVVFTRTDSLGGWHIDQAIVLLATFQIISGLRAAFVEPGLQWFGNTVKDGTFDALLVQPAPAVFLVTTNACAPLALMQVVLGCGLLGYGVNSVSVGSVVSWVVLVIAATAIMWAGRMLLAAIVFWAPDLTLDIIYDSIWQFARYPVNMYKSALRGVLTYCIPVAFLSTVPAGALVGRTGTVMIAVAVAVAGVLWVITLVAWRFGLRRYTSATS
jgi:ABC-2 type transport system permease protein